MLRFFWDYRYFKMNIWLMVKTIAGLYLAACFGVFAGLNYAQYKNPDDCMSFRFNVIGCESSSQATGKPPPHQE